MNFFIQQAAFKEEKKIPVFLTHLLKLNLHGKERDETGAYF